MVGWAVGVHRENLKLVDRVVLEKTAQVFGGDCAASRALEDANRHEGPVRFFLFRDQILVEKGNLDVTLFN